MENCPIIKTATDKNGIVREVRYCDIVPLAPPKLVSFFYKHMAELIDNGFSGSVVHFHNKCKAVYIEDNGNVVGLIMFEYLPDNRRTFIVLSAVAHEYRGCGIYSILHEQFEVVSKKLGATEISSFIHVDNTHRLKTAEAHGFLPKWYRMSKFI